MNDKINELYNKLDEQDEIIEQQVLEIAQLKNNIENNASTKAFIVEVNKNIKLQEKIDKAIEYIHSEEYWYSQVESEKKLLEILGDKEND